MDKAEREERVRDLRQAIQTMAEQTESGAGSWDAEVRGLRNDLQMALMMLADEMDTGLEREEAILRQAQMGQDRGRGIDTETMAHPSSSTSSSNQDVASMKLQIAALEENIRQLKGKENYLGRELAAARAQLEEANARKPQEEGQMVEKSNELNAVQMRMELLAKDVHKAQTRVKKLCGDTAKLEPVPFLSETQVPFSANVNTTAEKVKALLLPNQTTPSSEAALKLTQDLTKLVSEFEADLAQFSSRYPESQEEDVLSGLVASSSLQQEIAWLELAVSSNVVVNRHLNHRSQSASSFISALLTLTCSSLYRFASLVASLPSHLAASSAIPPRSAAPPPDDDKSRRADAELAALKHLLATKEREVASKDRELTELHSLAASWDRKASELESGLEEVAVVLGRAALLTVKAVLGVSDVSPQASPSHRSPPASTAKRVGFSGDGVEMEQLDRELEDASAIIREQKRLIADLSETSDRLAGGGGKAAGAEGRGKGEEESELRERLQTAEKRVKALTNALVDGRDQRDQLRREVADLNTTLREAEARAAVASPPALPVSPQPGPSARAANLNPGTPGHFSGSTTVTFDPAQSVRADPAEVSQVLTWLGVRVGPDSDSQSQVQVGPGSPARSHGPGPASRMPAESPGGGYSGMNPQSPALPAASASQSAGPARAGPRASGFQVQVVLEVCASDAAPSQSPLRPATQAANLNATPGPSASAPRPPQPVWSPPPPRPPAVPAIPIARDVPANPSFPSSSSSAASGPPGRTVTVPASPPARASVSPPNSGSSSSSGVPGRVVPVQAPRPVNSPRAMASPRGSAGKPPLPSSPRTRLGPGAVSASPGAAPTGSPRSPSGLGKETFM